jgi:Na+-driven multidrug efflux pump
VVAAGHDVIPRLFTSDGEVLEQARTYWPWFVAMLPLGGVVFAIDGVLFGAGDFRFLRNVTLLASLGAFLPVTLASAWLDLGLGGIWFGLSTFIWVRFVAGVLRWRRERWIVAGVALADEHR